MLSIQENGRADLDMDKVLCNGQMELNMRDNGLWVEHMVEVPFSILKEKCMKENGNMIRLKVMVSILILMERDMKESGFKTYNMEKGPKNGQMAQYLLENIEKVKRMVKASTSGLTGLNMKANGKIMRLQVMDSINGLMEENT